MTIILFIAVLFALILVHELGHFLTAKWAKMRVDEFAIGFPPRLFSFKRGETEYSINLLPIGGYVKIWGENGADAPMAPVSNEVSASSDSGRAFSARPRLHQAIVLLAGVAMNILVAWLIFFAVAMIGTPTAINESEVGNYADASMLVTGVLPESPADKANIPYGAKIVSATTENDSLQEITPTAFNEYVFRNAGKEITINYQHKNSEATAVLVTEAGIIESEPERQAIGIATALVTTVKENPIEAVMTASIRTYDALIAITIGIFTFIASSFTLSADISQVTGPIGIAGMVGDAAEFGFISLLIFTAFISLNLAVINLLPIPALDGGRLVFVFVEAVIRRPVNPEWMNRVNLIGFVFLILLMVAVTYNDIIRML